MIKWLVAAALLCGLAAIPVLPVVIGAVVGETVQWDHVAGLLLPRFFTNTVLLSLGVLSIAGLVGVGGAWLLARYRLPFPGMWRVALMLPLAVPAYLGAFAWVQWFPGITGLPASIIVMGLALSPYVFATLHPVFAGGMGNRLEAASMLGRRGWSLLFGAALPMVRPLLAGSLSLVLMETLNEYGTPSYFGVDTLSSGIFRSWFQFYDLGSSSRLAVLALGFILVIHFSERWLRGGRGFDLSGHRTKPQPQKLSWIATLGSVVFLSVPVVFGFLLPAGTMVRDAFLWLSHNPIDPELLTMVANTGLLVGASGLVIVISALVVAYANFLSKVPLLSFLARIAATGYAVPGAVIALGTMQLSGLLDHWGVGLGWVVSGSLPILVLAYHTRFFSVVYNPVQSALRQRSPHLHEAGELAGYGRMVLLFKVHLPLIGPVMLASLLLGTIDMIKELPMTMVLRTFDFPTLAVKTYELASNEMMAEASVSASVLIFLSLIILVTALILQRTIQKSRQGGKS